MPMPDLSQPDRFAVHFGVVPLIDDPDPASIAGHDDPAALFQVTPRIAVVGSWKCWGLDDQDTDGDDTLHVLLAPVHDVPLVQQITAARALLAERVDVGSRLLDYALITTTTWSERVAVQVLDDRLYFDPEES